MNIKDNLPISSAPVMPEILAKKKPKTEETQAPVPKDQVEITGSTRYKLRDGNYVEALESGDKIMGKIENMITGATTSVQVEMFRLGHPKIVDLLVQQAKQGVQVQVLLDPTPGYDPKDAEAQKKIHDYLKSNGVQLLKYPISGPSGKIDHVKMLIVDGKSLLIGGMNWDKHSPLNQDSNVFIRGPVVGDALDVFQNDWKISGGENIPGLKPPEKQEDANASVRMLTTEEDRQDINTALQENIKKAKKSIKMEAFALADKETIKNLIDAKNRGVDVKVLLDPNKPVYFANKKSADELKAAGIEVRWFDVDVQKKEKLHAKLALFDDDKTIIGSCNFTKNGLAINHEANVEVISKAVGTAFNKMFDEHWANRSLDEPKDLPDFYEKVGDFPMKEHLGKDVFRYFTETFHPGDKRLWTGKRKAAVLQAIEKFDKTEKPAPVEGLGQSGNNDAIDESKEMETIGDLASFFGDVENFKMKPVPGEDKIIYDARVEISEAAAKEVHKKVPGYLNDMANAIQNKQLREFVRMALEKAPSGFIKAGSSSTGKYHPADEVDPEKVNIKPGVPYSEYKGGGLVLHSRRVQAMTDKLCNHYSIKGKERDEILAAAALHDVMKGVTMEEMKKSMEEGTEFPWGHTTPEHGKVASEWIKMLDTSPGKKLTKNVRELIKNHMGIWNAPEKTPPSKMGEFIISIGDYVVSQRNIYLEV